MLLFGALKALIAVDKGPLQWKGKRLLKLELRTGVKSGFGSDFYSVQNNRRTEKNEGKDTQDAGTFFSS